MAARTRDYHGVDVTVYCSASDSPRRPATYKIAAEWIGGGFRELKTFGFADDACLEQVYRSAVKRAADIHLAEGEEMGRLGVYLLDPERHDAALARCTELEERLNAASASEDR